MTNSADPDQLADLHPHCLLRQGMSCSAKGDLKAVDFKRERKLTREAQPLLLD